MDEDEDEGKSWNEIRCMPDAKDIEMCVCASVCT